MGQKYPLMTIEAVNNSIKGFIRVLRYDLGLRAQPGFDERQELGMGHVVCITQKQGGIEQEIIQLIVQPLLGIGVELETADHTFQIGFSVIRPVHQVRLGSALNGQPGSWRDLQP